MHPPDPQLLSTVLGGAWRTAPPALSLGEGHWNAVAPLLLRTGAGGLGWWRIRQTPWKDGAAGHTLQQAYRLHSLRAAVREHHVRQVFARFAEAGVSALLVKGWSVARLYPQPGLRPSGDLDLYVAPRHYARARAIAGELEAGGCVTDLYSGVPPRYGSSFEELFERSLRIPLDGVQVSTPAPEDQLRLLCLHLWKHGAWRPLWLCDIAVALESWGGSLDWELCLGREPLARGWAEAALRLAHTLLGASVGGTPLELDRPLPRWILPAVLKAWSTPEVLEHQLRWRTALKQGGLREGLRQLRLRCRDPIRATVDLRRPFDGSPRLPLQIAATARAFWRAARGLPS